MDIDKSTYKHTDGDESTDATRILASEDAKEVALSLGEDVSHVGSWIESDVSAARNAIADREWSPDYADFVIDMYRSRCF